jgi:2-polyprenyl-3-methyl-5-hydroxy-6-metoxy-1,4-benzoquinol methylase
MEYLLRDIDVTPLRFKARSRAGSSVAPAQNGQPGARADGAVQKDVIRFLREHPGAHMNDLRTHVPPLGEWSYEEARGTIVRMIDLGLVEVAGQVPLEQLDDRYERLTACDLCGASSADHPIVFWKHNTPVVRCRSCGLLYSNPRWKTEYLFSYYGESYLHEYKRTVQETATDPEKNLRRWQPLLDPFDTARQTNRLLDVGCATGEFMLAAQARGWEAYGVEPGAPAADVAKQTTGCEIHAGTLDTAPYPDGWFDVVTLWDVIEHVQSPTAYMAGVARLIRPGGLLGVTTPNICCLNYWALGPHWSVVGPNGHIFYFAPGTLKRLLEKSGFSLTNLYSMIAEYEEPPAGLGYSVRGAVSKLLRAKAGTILERRLLGDELVAIARRK